MARRGNGGLVGKLNISGNSVATGVWSRTEHFHIKGNANTVAFAWPIPPAVSTYGYAMGGTTGATVVTTDRLSFRTGAVAAATVSNLSVARSHTEGLSDGATYGYVMGGYTGAIVGTTDRITFSTGVTAAHTAADQSTRGYPGAAISDNSLYGYSAGGLHRPDGGVYSVITDRITFSTSTTAARTAANLSQARGYIHSNLSDNSLYGYATGGTTTGGYVATTDRITFSTSTTAAHTAANLSVARWFTTGASDGEVYGYAMGGGNDANTYLTTADRITFSTSTTAAYTAANLSQARWGAAGLSDGAV